MGLTLPLSGTSKFIFEFKFKGRYQRHVELDRSKNNQSKKTLHISGSQLGCL